MGLQDTLTGENATKRNLDGVIKEQVPAVAQAATDFVLLVDCPFAGKVTEVSFYPKSTITGADTNTRIQRLYNRKADNSGTTVVASLQYNNGVNAPAKRKKTITLSATAADLVVAAGDVLEFNSAAVGNGLADVGGLLIVKIARD